MTSGGNNFNEFPDNYLTKSSPLNFYEASRFVSPLGCTPLTDTTDKQTNEQTNERTSVRPSVCLLDGVWHYRPVRAKDNL